VEEEDGEPKFEWEEAPGRGFEVAKGAEVDLGIIWGTVKE
jgi:hypothetical protein